MISVNLVQWGLSHLDLLYLANEPSLNKRIRLRFRALAMVVDGKSAARVATEIKRHHNSVLEWIHNFNSGGPSALGYTQAKAPRLVTPKPKTNTKAPRPGERYFDWLGASALDFFWGSDIEAEKEGLSPSQFKKAININQRIVLKSLAFAYLSTWKFILDVYISVGFVNEIDRAVKALAFDTKQLGPPWKVYKPEGLSSPDLSQALRELKKKDLIGWQRMSLKESKYKDSINVEEFLSFIKKTFDNSNSENVVRVWLTARGAAVVELLRIGITG